MDEHCECRRNGNEPFCVYSEGKNPESAIRYARTTLTTAEAVTFQSKRKSGETKRGGAVFSYSNRGKRCVDVDAENTASVIGEKSD